MSEMKNGSSEFPPCQCLWDTHAGHTVGLTKREWFAGMALQGMLANNFREGFSNDTREGYSFNAYLLAEAMLKQSAEAEGR